MADMDVDVDPTPVVKSKGKSKEDGKDGKKRFEVKKVCSLVVHTHVLADRSLMLYTTVECRSALGLGSVSLRLSLTKDARLLWSYNRHRRRQLCYLP